MSDSGEISWSTLMRWRTECHQRFGAVTDLPVRSAHEELKTLVRPGMRVLDVGAGAHMPFRSAIAAAGAEYASLDADPSGTFDYRSFADVPVDLCFDLIMANQVLEHLCVDDAFSMVKAAFEHLSDGGHVFATVPNAAHPVRQRDCTHITAWPANDLYSLLKSAGFEVASLARYNKFPLTGNPIKRWLVTTLCHEFRMDWCDSILAVAVKK